MEIISDIMKIAVPVSEKNEAAIMAKRFGRASYYLIYNDQNDEIVFEENPAVNARGGAGIQAVEFLISKGINTVIVPEVGPNAERVLRTADIDIFQGLDLSSKELFEKWKNNELKKI